MIMTSAAAVFGWLLVYYKFPETVVGVFETFGAGRYGVLLAVVTVFLVLGTVLESIPAIIMLLPIIQALGDGAGIHPVQMGVIVVMTTALGMVTPPHGVCLLVAAKIMGMHPRGAILVTLAFGSVGLSVILLCVFISDLPLLIPRTLMARYF